MPLVYAGMAAIALMAVPVVGGPDGPQTALGGEFVEEPVLGVVSAFEPAWVADTMRWVVALVAAPVLIWAASTSMLGVSRHIYTLAINRQIPSWLGKLDRRTATPYVAIAISGLIAIGLVDPDQRQAAGRDLRLRGDAGDHDRPPLDHPPAGHRAGANGALPGSRGHAPGATPSCRCRRSSRRSLSGLAFLSVLAYHSTARWVGVGWMAFGLTFYVIYRKVFEGTTLTKRVTVTERALTKQGPEVEFSNILVPVFGTRFDDDIVATAGRLAAAERADAARGSRDSRLDVVYVIEVPLTLPLDAKLPTEREEQARRALERAREVGEEYEDVERQRPR